MAKNKSKNTNGKTKQNNNNNQVARVSTKSMPNSYGTKLGNPGVPRIDNRGDGSCVISHMEFVTDVTGLSGDGSFSLFEVNPQRANLFTWLTAIATRFEQYKFEKLKFHFKPSAGTATSGYVILGFDFDSYDQDQSDTTTLPTKAELLTWKYSSKCAPWQETSLNVSADARLSTMRYCDYSTRGDKRLDVLGNLIVRANSTSTLFVGEIFVEYTVRFRQPSYKIPPALFSTVTNNVPWVSINDWFTLGVTVPQGNLDIGVFAVNKLIVKDVGDYLINIVLAAASGVTQVPTMVVSQPTYAPTASWIANLVTAGNGTTYASAVYRLAVDVAPVILSFAGAGGSGITGSTYFSTYKSK